MHFRMPYLEMVKRRVIVCLVFSMFLYLGSNSAGAANVITNRMVSRDGGTIFINGRRILRLRHLGDFKSIDERAETMCQTLNLLFEKPPWGKINFYVSPQKKTIDAYCNTKKVFTIFKEDASRNKSEMLDLALLWLNQVQMEFYKLYDGYEGRVVNKIIGLASWYGGNFSGQITACEEIFNPYAFTAAHRTLPIGSILLVTNSGNGKRVVVRINDRGPHYRGWEIDLSLAAARAIGMQDDGVDKVAIEVIE